MVRNGERRGTMRQGEAKPWRFACLHMRWPMIGAQPRWCCGHMGVDTAMGGAWT